MHIKFLENYKLQKIKTGYFGRGYWDVNSINSISISNLLAYFLNIFKWAYFYHCPFITGKGGFTIKNGTLVMNENEVQLKQTRDR